MYTITKRKLGKGGFGTIYKCQRKSDGKIFALKHTEPKNKEQRQSVINECSMLKFLDCPQLLNCEEVFDFKTCIWIMLEYMEGGDLTAIIT